MTGSDRLAVCKNPNWESSNPNEIAWPRTHDHRQSDRIDTTRACLCYLSDLDPMSTGPGSIGDGLVRCHSHGADRARNEGNIMSYPFELKEISLENIQYIKGIPFPAEMTFRQLLVTGPPGCGKTVLMEKVGGWPEEGYIDLTFKNWWRAQSLTFRPREVHLGFPFIGHREALTVFDKEWLESAEPPKLELDRIRLPPRKTHLLSTDWRARFMFEILIPSPQHILEWRIERKRRGTHPIDQSVTLEQIEKQSAVFWEIALYFHRAGMPSYVRNELQGMPKRVAEAVEYA